ncbi:ABC transporter permease subunit [Beduinella massiliensis]|uniref:ABC transporter permease subunit n=1 Tax=Beduinella massiliensis TaxID=1852363 RepID=UPI000C8556EB
MKRLTRSPKERFFDSLIRIILILAAILTLFPFLYVVMISLLSPAEYMSRGLVFPLRPTLNNYAMLFKWGTKIQNAYLVTIGTTVVGTAISLSATALLAYGLSRPALPGKSFVNGMLVLTMFFSGGLIPTYMVIKTIGLMNTYWALILPGSLSVWNVMVMRTFFKELPVELEESAVLDGASDARVAFSIMFPLSKASFATIGLFYAVGYWNQWYSAMLYLNDSKMYPLQMALREIINTNAATAMDATKMAGKMMDSTPPSIVTKMTSIVVSIGPVLILYPFVQKYFVKGVMVGSLKG